MNSTPIAECKTKVGQVIPCVTGIIAKVWPRKTGEKVNQKGQKYTWSIQNGELSDDTGLIKFSIFGASDEMPKDYEGKEVSIISTMGRSGLAGILVENNEYNGKTTVQLKIEKTAKVVLGTPKTAFEGSESVSATQTPTANKNASEPRLSASEPITLDDQIERYRVLYEKCYKAAIRVEGVSEEMGIKDVASCFFIQSIKDGLLNQIQLNEVPF